MAKAVKERLTELQMEVLDCLSDDQEDLEQIRNILRDKQTLYTETELRESLKILIQRGYLRCHEPKGFTLQRVEHPDFRKLARYWFELTDQGRSAL
ncbi:hypothetical protein HYR54_11910 [Candidatus Acetothermia bacterium]|nr:hypothetical protein [Candidatus Acetothermia bacterium]MBI3659322.1 hypothetical protein [Candidatus Acetothermia bacterium]